MVGLIKPVHLRTNLYSFDIVFHTGNSAWAQTLPYCVWIVQGSAEHATMCLLSLSLFLSLSLLTHPLLQNTAAFTLSYRFYEQTFYSFILKEVSTYHHFTEINWMDCLKIKERTDCRSLSPTLSLLSFKSLSRACTVSLTWPCCWLFLAVTTLCFRVLSSPKTFVVYHILRLIFNSGVSNPKKVCLT